MSKLKEAKKIKVVALYEQTPKQFEPDPNPQNSLFFAPKKLKKMPFKQMKLKATQKTKVVLIDKYT